MCSGFASFGVGNVRSLDFNNFLVTPYSDLLELQDSHQGGKGFGLRLRLLLLPVQHVIPFWAAREMPKDFRDGAGVLRHMEYRAN